MPYDHKEDKVNYTDNSRALYNAANFFLKQDADLEFMNHGYHPIDPKLINTSILLKNSATLYSYTLDKINLNDVNSILEIGCGRGGGISLIKDMYNVNDICGCDISEENINYCIKNHDQIDFKVQDACNLNYEKKFDVILNIESSHCYSDIKKFFQGVLKFLNSDGFFLYADVFYPKDLNFIKSELEKKFFIIKEEDITENVYFSCINSIKTLRENIEKNKCNYYTHSFVLNIFKDKKNLYKNRDIIFYIFICKPKIK